MAKKHTNREIADILRAMAVCYEMEGVSFKPAAYERAADSLETLGEDATAILKRDGQKALIAIPGIGKAIAGHIEDLMNRGDFKEYKTCRAKMPEETLELISIRDLGPKKVKVLYDKLKVETIKDLERAARAGKVSALPGFGEKSEEKIMKGIAMLKKAGERRILADVLPLTRELERKLKSTPGVKHAVTAGSVRRRKETVGDIDMVITTSQPKKAMDTFAEFDEVRKVLKRGRRNLTALLKNGMTCDLLIVPDDVFGAALQHFTGSKDHNVVIRKMAGEKGLKLNEYGLWRGKRRLAARTEKNVYRALDLPYIEPELRTASGEVEAAMKDKLPDIITYGSVRGDLQTQTDWSDGAASIEDMARAAIKLGLEYIAITDHTKTLVMAGGLDERKLAKQAKEIARVNAKLAEEGLDFMILKGAEVNVMKNGRLDISDTALAKLDFVGVAIHSSFRLSREEQTARMIRAMKNPHVDAFFHPTGRIIHRRDPYDIDIEKILKTAKTTGTAMEIDAYPNRSDLRDVHVRMAVKRGVKLVIDTDAHHPDHLEFLDLGVAIARRGWTKKRDVLNTRKVDSLLKWLKTAKSKRR
ncbi:MAG: DNA polymerase/3'-5' exonuclease PolX [Patescibacteria group bacterium]|nr:DNA polymerase/3'-5' exonuclease PolX [Patescibacteria group bacterium]